MQKIHIVGQRRFNNDDDDDNDNNNNNNNNKPRRNERRMTHTYIQKPIYGIEDVTVLHNQGVRTDTEGL